MRKAFFSLEPLTRLKYHSDFIFFLVSQLIKHDSPGKRGTYVVCKI